MALIRITATLLLFAAMCWGLYMTLTHPKKPIHPAWNPTQPLKIDDPVTPLTMWKLKRTVSEPELCLSALESGPVEYEHLPDFEHSPQCHIRPRVKLSAIGNAALRPVETRCAIALRSAMWLEHDLGPKAQELFNQDIARIHHQSSYNCRAIRSVGGATNRMSTHATADAIDIKGFTLADGTDVDLLSHWDAGDAREIFLKSARDSACKWFIMTLSPDFNSLHADHFHLQSKGWSSCR